MAESTPRPRRKSGPRTFTSTIYCGNCRNVGEYEFRRGAILHTQDRYPYAEIRHRVPGDREHTIRVDHATNGRLVACKFCKCVTALTIRERSGDTLTNPERHAATEKATAITPSLPTSDGELNPQQVRTESPNRDGEAAANVGAAATSQEVR